MKEIIVKNDLMRFIESHSDWKELLQDKPYRLIIKEDEDFPNVYLFKYNIILSDMNQKISQEARGIILEVTENSDGSRSTKLLAHSFDKFFNYTEPQGQLVLENFNWDDYSFQEKRDGSLLRLWFYNGKWNVSTSGTIDAHKANMDSVSTSYSSFGDMFDEIFSSYEEDVSVLDEGITYSFEMTSPNNKIVVDYTFDELTLIGMRVNKLNMEIDPVEHNPFKGIVTAVHYNFSNLDRALGVINTMGNFEGLVLTDSNFNRVKIKTDEYLVLAKITDETSSDRGIMRMVMDGRIDDVLNRLPHLQSRIDRVRDYLNEEMNKAREFISSIDLTQDKKTIALSIQDSPYRFLVFNQLKYADQDAVSTYYSLDNLEKIYKDYRDKFYVSEESKKEVN